MKELSEYQKSKFQDGTLKVIHELGLDDQVWSKGYPNLTSAWWSGGHLCLEYLQLNGWVKQVEWLDCLKK